MNLGYKKNEKIVHKKITGPATRQKIDFFYGWQKRAENCIPWLKNIYLQAGIMYLSTWWVLAYWQA
jgi:hypothetical protein